MTLPLEGVRVLAVEQYGAGPFGTMFLADQGAEVIKIENPHDGGDISRDVGPFFFEPHDSVFYHSFNRNKKSMTLDLRQAAGQEVLHDLVAGCDALTSNLRGDVPEKLGLTYAHLKASNPKIVCAHLSAYGRTGPRASWPGFDYLMQAEAGFLSLTGEPDAPPARFGLSMVDFMTGLGLAYAVLAALTAARTSGIGRDMDVSLFDMALANTSYVSAWYLNQGHCQDRLPRSAHPSLTPCQLYPTSDGWIFIMCNKEKFWPALCELVERPEWISDPRFADIRRSAHEPRRADGASGRGAGGARHRGLACTLRRPRPGGAGDITSPKRWKIPSSPSMAACKHSPTPAPASTVWLRRRCARRKRRHRARRRRWASIPMPCSPNSATIRSGCASYVLRE